MRRLKSVGTGRQRRTGGYFFFSFRSGDRVFFEIFFFFYLGRIKERTATRWARRECMKRTKKDRKRRKGEWEEEEVKGKKGKKEGKSGKMKRDTAK